MSQDNSTHFAIIGNGSQAKAWAENLFDSKISFSMLLRPGSKYLEASEKSKFPVFSLDNREQLATFDYIALLIPDNQHFNVLEQITPYLKPKATFIYAHGYSMLSEKLNQKFSNFGHLLLAPKAIASQVRQRFLQQQKLSAIISYEHSTNHQNDKKFLSLLLKGIGANTVIESTFKHECFADLLSEQALLCSTLLEAPKRVYDLMLSKGIPKEVAFVECFEEMKLIVDTLLQYGPEAFFQFISPNALCGGSKAMEILFDSEYQTKLENLWKELENGSFFEWMKEQNPASTRQQLVNNWKKSQLDKIFSENLL